MSRAPWSLPKPERAFPAGSQELFSTTIGWRMVNKRLEPQWSAVLGEGAVRRNQHDEVPGKASPRVPQPATTTGGRPETDRDGPTAVTRPRPTIHRAAPHHQDLETA